MSQSKTPDKRPSDDQDNKDGSHPEVPKELLSALEGLDEEKRSFILSQIYSVKISQSHSGPLPSPEKLHAYDNIIESGAERIMKMAENQSRHRIKMEDTAIRRQFNQSAVGQIFALVIAVIALIISWHLASIGHDEVAGIIGGTTVVGLVSAFIYGKKSQQQDLDSKN